MPVLITAEGTRTDITPKGQRFTYDELYRLIGCDTIELVWPRKHNHVMLVVDEMGLMKRLPPNMAGCELYGGAIVGTIVVFTRSEYNALLRNHKDPKVPEYDKIPGRVRMAVALFYFGAPAFAEYLRQFDIWIEKFPKIL